MTWSEANEACKNMGTKLVEIDSRAENNGIVREIRKMGYKERHFWMGLTDLRKEGVWRLESTGRKPSYTNWAAGEPNDHGGEDCAHLRIEPGTNIVAWNDHECNSKRDEIFHWQKHTFHAICESLLTTTTTKTTIQTTTSGGPANSKAPMSSPILMN